LVSLIVLVFTMIDMPAPAVKPSTLTQQAIDALKTAATVQPIALVEERSVWQPGSWLIHRAWEALADAGAGEAALAVAALAQQRHPLAPVQALQRIARQVTQHPLLRVLVNDELERLSRSLFRPITPGEAAQMGEQLLQVATAAALVGNLELACACLERIDQFDKPWNRIFARTELRNLLAESFIHIGPHPLTLALLSNAIRRFDDAGAQFLHQIALLVLALGDAAPRRSKRLLHFCVETFRYATLTSLNGRRLAATTLGQAGLVDEVLSQMAFIANVQDARRETGLSPYKEDPLLVRQVKRPAANADVDFQVYTLQQAINAMPLRQLPREQRIALADQLAFLGMRSDGWTAAGAASTLIELGALKYAVDVVNKIAPNDPTRSEGMLSLVRGLLAVDEGGLAAEQAQRALAWARARPDRNPERAITWGLAEIYLEHGEPQTALRWLDQWREPTGLRHRLGSLWRNAVDDDTLRLHSLRLRALLQRGGVHGDAAALRAYNKEVRALFDELRSWAPRLLEGEALVNFLVDSLLRPLLLVGRRSQAWTLLPDLVATLKTTSGNKHAAQVAEVAALFAQQVRLAAAPGRLPIPPVNGDTPSPAEPTEAPDQELHQTIERFLPQLWQADAQRGAWQIVHSLEGSIPLILALEGPTTLVAIAHAAYDQPHLWAA
jgi:hypothetical protein